MTLVLENISVREVAKLLGISPTHAYRLMEHQTEHLTEHFTEHLGLNKGLKVSVLSGSIRNSEGTLDGTLGERNVNKERSMVSPATPSLTKEINKERGELEIFPHTSEISSSTSVEDDVSVEEVNGQRIDYKSFMIAFNSQIAGTHIPKITGIKGPRRAKMRARINEYGKEAFWKACLNMKNSDWMKDKPNCSNFDWMIRPTNFPKVLEGNYNR